MKFHIVFLFAIIAFIGTSLTVQAQVNNLAQSQIDAVIGQISNSAAESFAGGISGDGRFVVFESTGNLATDNPRNTDGNREIFLFDYAQRRIFQITDTRSLRTDTTLGFTQTNTRVLIANVRPVISNDGRWLAFGSNATTAVAGSTTANTTNPGSFDAESFNPVSPATTPNPLLADGNTEMWLYAIPAVAAANLSTGEELAVTNLSGGAFTRITNTAPSRLPSAGSSSNVPIIGDDNRDASLNDDGNYLAFVSNRDLVPTGNAAPQANDEIFTYFRTGAVTNQITVTNRGNVTSPVYNQSPTISGSGTRVAFLSNADNPFSLTVAGNNADRNVEIFFADLNGANGSIGTNRRQVTTTARVNPGDLVNILDFGRRMSRDGRYIAFDSYADLAGENGGTNYASFALYVFDVNVVAPAANPFRRIGPRSDADAAVNGGDNPHYAGFTDTAANGAPSTLVFETRANILDTGAVAPDNNSGLNPNVVRPAQIYAYPLNVTDGATFKRLTTLPNPNTFIASTQPIPSNSVRRMTFNLALTEVGTGNNDLQSEAFYFLLPIASQPSAASFTFSTGASGIPVSASPVPTPTATPTPSPSPSVSPTPQTPVAVQGVAPGMLVRLSYSATDEQIVTPRTAIGSLARSFSLPIELSGVTLTINGAAVGLQSVSRRQIVFVVPPGLIAVNNAPTVYPVVINNNGTVSRGSITIVPARPDIFTLPASTAPVGNPPRPGIGINRARLFDVTNTVARTEPFNITTRRIRGGVRVPTVFRLFLTGLDPRTATGVTISFGSLLVNVPTVSASNLVLREPGVYSIDFTLPAAYLNAGDVPIIVSTTINGVTYTSRLDDTAPRTRIL